MQTETFPVRNRWTNPVKSRKSSPRAVAAVRARVAHTSAQKRRLDIFVTGPVCGEAGWTSSGFVKAQFLMDGARFLVRLSPSHSGLKAMPNGPRTNTLRIAISGAPLIGGLCAKVRDISFEVDGSVITASLPLEWAEEFQALMAEPVA